MVYDLAVMAASIARDLDSAPYLDSGSISNVGPAHLRVYHLLPILDVELVGLFKLI